MDEQDLDRHLGAVFDEMIIAIQEIKQASWSASNGEQREALDELRTFLVDNVTVVADAEERIGGRDPSLASPTGHRARNLLGEAGGDEAALVRLLRADLEAVATDVRQRADEIAGSEEAKLFAAVADGLDERLARLAS